MFILREFKKIPHSAHNTAALGNLTWSKHYLRGLGRVQSDGPAAPQAVGVASNQSLQSELDSGAPTAAAAARELGTSKRDERTLGRTDGADQLPSVDVEDRSFVPTFNLAAYVNKSPTLQQLVKLGVDLSQLERQKGLAEFTLRLNFDEHVRPHLLFLQDQGVPADVYGELITKNPLIFKVDLDDLQTRVNYLEAKKFTAHQRTRIITHNPYWLMFSTRRIDRRLGHFQQQFKLAGDDVRFLAAKQPRLITYNMEHIRKSTFCIREEMGFEPDEMKCLLLNKPRLWMLKSDDLIERFAYAHKDMELSHDMILQFPEVLVSREFRLRQRHEFLKLLGRAQYNPEKDLYISPKDVVEGTDHYFVRNIAKSNMKTYELFLKTR